MAERTDSIRFFFLKPRLLKHRQLIEEHDCRAGRAANFAVADSTVLDCSFAHDLAAAARTKNIEH